MEMESRNCFAPAKQAGRLPVRLYQCEQARDASVAEKQPAGWLAGWRRHEEKEGRRQRGGEINAQIGPATFIARDLSLWRRAWHSYELSALEAAAASLHEHAKRSR